MRLRDQVALAAVLAVATYFALRHVAEGKSEAAVGGGVFRPDEHHREEAEAFDRLRDEAPAYDAEIDWYEARRRSGFLDTLPAEERRAWEWGIESAILSARKARERAG